MVFLPEKHKLFLYKEDFDKFADSLKEIIEYIREANPQPIELDEVEQVEIPVFTVPMFQDWPQKLQSEDCEYENLYIYEQNATASKGGWGGLKYYSASSFEECGDGCYESREDTFFYRDGYFVDYGEYTCEYFEVVE